MGTLDIYQRPQKIMAIAPNGSYRRILNPDEYIIMYDNNGRYPLFLDITQYAERIALDTRTIDINILQQRTPRFWKTSSDKERSVRDIINNVDALENIVLTYDDINLDDITQNQKNEIIHCINEIADTYLNIMNEINVNKESVDLNQMWLLALESYRGRLHLKEQDYEQLIAFSRACGYLDKNMQKRNLDMVIEKLEHERKISQEKYERCSKLNKSLGILIGATLVIFLI